MNTDSRLTETSACLTSGVIPVSGLFIFRPWNINHSFGLPLVLSKRCSKMIDSPLYSFKLFREEWLSGPNNAFSYSLGTGMKHD
jgi:hypothetical protein